MVRLPVPVLLAALQLALALAQTSVAQDAAAQTFHHKPKPPRKCIGTTERPVRQIKLPSGEIFCLRLPRFLKNPELDVLGTKKFVRTWGDTCGLYSIVFSTFVPQGAGPPAHIHYAEDEWFLPGTEGDVVRIHAQAQGTGPYKQYLAGQVPGFNMPSITVGGVEVPYGSIGYSPINTPHTFKAATNMTNFMAIWGFGFGMIPGVNIPEEETNATVVLEQTGLWGVPTDITGAMFGGPQFVKEARGPLALPPLTVSIMQRLQNLFDQGEKCCLAC